MLTYVQFANDECDYGMGYELGMDLFCYGSHVSTTEAMHVAVTHYFLCRSGVGVYHSSLFLALITYLLLGTMEVCADVLNV